MPSIVTTQRNHAKRLRSLTCKPMDRNTGLVKRDRILIQATKVGPIFIGFGYRDVLCSQLTEAEELAKQYNEDEARDQNGQWTSGGGISQATSAAAALVPAANPARGIGDFIGKIPNYLSIFEKLGPQALAGLAELAATFAAPVAFLGAYFFPFDRSAVASDTLPGHPDINYNYDSDTGHFTLYTNNSNIDERQILFTGAGADGLIRTEQGDVVGRRVDGSVIVDVLAASWQPRLTMRLPKPMRWYSLKLKRLLMIRNYVRIPSQTSLEIRALGVLPTRNLSAVL